jgi:hypothetical protein
MERGRRKEERGRRGDGEGTERGRKWIERDGKEAEEAELRERREQRNQKRGGSSCRNTIHIGEQGRRVEADRRTRGIRVANVGARLRCIKSIRVMNSTAKPRPHPQYLSSSAGNCERTPLALSRRITEPWLGKDDVSESVRAATLFHAPMHPRIHFFTRDHPPRRGRSEYETGAKRPMEAVRISGEPPREGREARREATG